MKYKLNIYIYNTKFIYFYIIKIIVYNKIYFSINITNYITSNSITILTEIKKRKLLLKLRFDDKLK